MTVPKNPDNSLKLIDLLLYSSPNSGGHTIQDMCVESGIETYYTHNKHFFKASEQDCQNNQMGLDDYIDYQVKLRRDNKLKIMLSYREIFEQQISNFFQCWDVYDEAVHALSTHELIQYFNNHILKISEVQNNFFELFTAKSGVTVKSDVLIPGGIVNLDISDFKLKNNYFYYESESIEFYIVRFRDFSILPEILSSIFTNFKENTSIVPRLINTTESHKYYSNILTLRNSIIYQSTFSNT